MLRCTKSSFKTDDFIVMNRKKSSYIMVCLFSIIGQFSTVEQN